MPSASANRRLPDAALARQPHARVAEPVDRIDPHDLARFFRQRQRHAAAAAAGVEHAAAHRDAGALEERDDLGAAVVLEQGVVVFGAKAQVGVRLDGALVNRAHASRSERPCRGRNGVSATSNVMMMRQPGYAVEHVEDLVSLVADLRIGIRQNIPHIPAVLPVGVIAELRAR